jgi:hypothetical protein
MGGASSEACGREFIMKKLPSYMRVTRGLALANQKNALAVNNFECRWNFGEGHHSFRVRRDPGRTRDDIRQFAYGCLKFLQIS